VREVQEEEEDVCKVARFEVRPKLDMLQGKGGRGAFYRSWKSTQTLSSQLGEIHTKILTSEA
jgi:hypothetical protein